MNENASSRARIPTDRCNRGPSAHFFRKHSVSRHDSRISHCTREREPKDSIAFLCEASRLENDLRTRPPARRITFELTSANSVRTRKCSASHHRPNHLAMSYLPRNRITSRMGKHSYIYSVRIRALLSFFRAGTEFTKKGLTKTRERVPTVATEAHFCRKHSRFTPRPTTREYPVALASAFFAKQKSR